MQLVRFIPALVVAALAACSTESTVGVPTSTANPPTAGWLTVKLTTPNTNDGAVQLALTGPAVDSVVIVGYDGFATRSDDAVDMVVVGQITSGDVARIHVPDTTLASEYQVTVSAAATRDSYQLQPTQGYDASVGR